MRWGGEGAAAQQPAALLLTPCPPTPPPQVNNVTPLQGCDVAEAQIFPINVDQSPMRDVLVLLAMLIALRLATYWSLKRKTTFKSG